MFAETRDLRRRGAARLSPRLSLQRAARHAGGAHAASAGGRGARPRGGAARRRARQSLARALAARVGSAARVLVERPGFGRSEHYAPVDLPSEFPPGAIASVRLVASTRGTLIGAPA